MTSRSKAKGDGYERELADYFTQKTGLQVRRTPLSGGGAGGEQLPDLEGTTDLWIEAKRTERFEPHKAMAQAERGKKARHCPDMPIVISRRSREPSMVFMHLDDFMTMYRAYLQLQGVKISGASDVPTEE